MKSNSQRVRLDVTDRKILGLLQGEGRMTHAELAKRVGLSAPSVLERVKKLERSGVIRGYAAMVDPAAVGVRCFTYVEVRLLHHGSAAVNRFLEQITPMPEVLECHHITGEADFLLRVASRDIPAYEEFILHRLTALPDVQHLKTLVVLSTLKQETRLPVADSNSEETT